MVLFTAVAPRRDSDSTFYSPGIHMTFYNEIGARSLLPREGMQSVHDVTRFQLVDGSGMDYPQAYLGHPPSCKLEWECNAFVR